MDQLTRNQLEDLKKVRVWLVNSLTTKTNATSGDSARDFTNAIMAVIDLEQKLTGSDDATVRS